MSISKNICFIPAKAASTRLKKKNILQLNGKELIYYPIQNAHKSGLFNPNDIILSTESEEIKNIAECHGAKVPYLRDKKLAKDPYGIVDVILDFFEHFPNYKLYDTLCILLPTAPLTIAEDLTKAYKIFCDTGAAVVMSVTETEHNALRSVFVQDNLVKPISPQFINKKSQELESTYRLNGAVTFIKINAFLKYKSYFIEPWGAYIMPSLRSVDIDNQAGYLYAKFLMEQSVST